MFSPWFRYSRSCGGQKRLLMYVNINTYMMLRNVADCTLTCRPRDLENCTALSYPTHSAWAGDGSLWLKVLHLPTSAYSVRCLGPRERRQIWRALLVSMDFWPQAWYRETTSIQHSLMHSNKQSIILCSTVTRKTDVDNKMLSRFFLLLLFSFFTCSRSSFIC